MADGPMFTPEQQQAIVQFKQRYPDAPTGPSDLLQFFQRHPEAREPYVRLLQTVGFTKDGPFKDWHLNLQSGEAVHEMSGKKFALIAGAIAGGPFAAQALGAFGAGGAATGTDALALGPVAASGGTTAATVPPALAANAPAAGGILGALGRYSGAIGDVGNVLSEAAGASASGRRLDDQINARGIAENNQAKTNAAVYNRDLPAARTNQVARGEVLNTMQDAPLTGDARIDKFAGGGLRPSAFGPQSRQAGAEMSRQALGHLMDPASDRLTPQEIPPTQASTPENIAAGVGIGADLFSLLAKYGRQPNGTR